MAWLTGLFGSSLTMATPRLVEAGTSRLDGIWLTIGALSVFSTSGSARPTLESDRLSTMRSRSRG